MVSVMQGHLMSVLEAPCITATPTPPAVQVMRRVIALALQQDSEMAVPQLLRAVAGTHPDWDQVEQLRVSWSSSKPSKIDPVLRSKHLGQLQQTGDSLSATVSVEAVHQALQEDVALFTARKQSTQIYPSTATLPTAEDVHFDTSVAGSNLLRVLRVGEHQLDCELRPDSNSCAHSRHFYFGVKSKQTTAVHFCINNLRFEEAKMNMFNLGGRPLMYSSALEGRGVGWVQLDQAARVVVFRNCLGSEIDPLWSLCFQVEVRTHPVCLTYRRELSQ